MKTNPLPALLAASLLVSALTLPTAALAFTEVARGSLTLSTTGRVAYDSNLMGNATGQGDTVFTLAPTLNYNRAAGLGSISASAGVAVNRYVDLTSLNSDDITSSLRIALPTPDGARQQGAITAGYTDTSDIDETVGERIRSKTWRTGFSGTYRAGTRTDLRTNFNYSDTTRGSALSSSSGPGIPAGVARESTQWGGGAGFDYNGFLGGFGLSGDYRYSDTQSSAATIAGSSIDQASHSVSSGLFYRFTSGLRASADVGYRWIDRSATETASGQTNNNGMTFGIKLDGPFLPASRFPKLKSSFSIGLEKGQSLGINDTGSTTVVGNISLAWQARERTALTISASRSQGLSSGNQSSVDNTVRLGATQRIGERTSLSATLGQDWNSYPGTGRSDRRSRGGLNLGYSLNKNWQTGAAYSATLSSSSSAKFDYDRHLVSAFVACTF
jgi:hypothetical protein